MRLRAIITTCALAGGLALGTAGTAVAAPVADPERYSVTPTGWGWYFTADQATINNWANLHNMRVIDVEVVTPSLFSVALVHNSGTYQRGLTGSASWTFGLTTAGLDEQLRTKRLLDVERYTAGGQTLFAAAFVDNPPTNFHDTTRFSGTPAAITAEINACGCRITDIDHVGTGTYEVLLMPNTGVDAKAWWWYFGKTAGEVNQLLNDNRARLVDVEPDGSGTFAVVMVASHGEYWGWLAAATAAEINDSLQQSGMRVIHIKRHQEAHGGVPRYAVIFLDNLDPVSVTARQAMWPAAGSADFGFYLKRVDGPVVNALQADKKFEPASMLKALHHVHALRAVHNGSASLNEPTTWYEHPNHAGCAYDDTTGDPITTNPHVQPLSSVLQGMMEQSDNRKTDAVLNRFGRVQINATADWLGMADTELNHRIGCTPLAPGDVDASNELTLADDGKLFEAVYRANNPILGTGSDRDSFTTLMADGLGVFASVVDEEATALGKQAVAAQFKSAMRGAFKGGSYTNGTQGATCDANGCTEMLLRRTGGGMVALPAKSNNVISLRHFVYGTFVDGVFDCAPGNVTGNCVGHATAISDARSQATKEMLRPHIKAALLTW